MTTKAEQPTDEGPRSFPHFLHMRDGGQANNYASVVQDQGVASLDVLSEWLRLPRDMAADIMLRAGLVVLHTEDQARAAVNSNRDFRGHLPGIWIPYRLPDREAPVWSVLRVSKPFDIVKYISERGTHHHVYFGPSLLDPHVAEQSDAPIWVTDLERKCLVAEAFGAHALAIPGIAGWRSPRSKLMHVDFLRLHLSRRKVFFAVDWTGVQEEARRFASALHACGAIVDVIDFPSNPTSGRDFLVRN